MYCLLFLGIESLSGLSTSWSSSHSQLSINTQLPVINNALKFLNQSPVAHKKLNNQKYLEKKITDVKITYLSTTFGLEKKSEYTILAQEFLDTIETLKKKFDDKETTKKKKFKFSLYYHRIGALIKFVISWKQQKTLSKSQSL